MLQFIGSCAAIAARYHLEVEVPVGDPLRGVAEHLDMNMPDANRLRVVVEDRLVERANRIKGGITPDRRRV